MDVHTFKVYVTETGNFLTKLEPIKSVYDKPKDTFINTIPFDYHSNSYFCSLATCYVAMFKSGISEDHLTNNFPNSHSNIVTSVVRFHLHFHLSRFMRNPKLLDQYLTRDDIRTIRKFTPVHETWERRTDSSHANIGTWYYDKPVNERGRIRRQKYHLTKYGGTFIEYEYLTGRSHRYLVDHPSTLKMTIRPLFLKHPEDLPKLDKSYSSNRSKHLCTLFWGHRPKLGGVLRVRVQRACKRRRFSGK
jgi:hypothetical protein